jgi:hypothetical protein
MCKMEKNQNMKVEGELLKRKVMGEQEIRE